MFGSLRLHFDTSLCAHVLPTVVPSQLLRVCRFRALLEFRPCSTCWCVSKMREHRFISSCASALPIAIFACVPRLVGTFCTFHGALDGQCFPSPVAACVHPCNPHACRTRTKYFGCASMSAPFVTNFLLHGNISIRAAHCNVLQGQRSNRKKNDG